MKYPRPHAEKGSLCSHDAAAHRRQFRPITIWGPPLIKSWIRPYNSANLSSSSVRSPCTVLSFRAQDFGLTTSEVVSKRYLWVVVSGEPEGSWVLLQFAFGSLSNMAAHLKKRALAEFSYVIQVIQMW